MQSSRPWSQRHAAEHRGDLRDVVVPVVHDIAHSTEGHCLARAFHHRAPRTPHSPCLRPALPPPHRGPPSSTSHPRCSLRVTPLVDSKKNRTSEMLSNRITLILVGLAALLAAGWYATRGGGAGETRSALEVRDDPRPVVVERVDEHETRLAAFDERLAARLQLRLGH